MTTNATTQHPASDALSRIMDRLSSSHIEHAEADRIIVADALESIGRAEPGRVHEALKAEIDRLIDACNGHLDTIASLKTLAQDQTEAIATRDAAIGQRDAEIVELRTGRDNALTAAATAAEKFDACLKLIRACLDSQVLETEATKLQAIRTAIDAA